MFRTPKDYPPGLRNGGALVALTHHHLVTLGPCARRPSDVGLDLETSPMSLLQAWRSIAANSSGITKC
jgi:hypothetical protein